VLDPSENWTWDTNKRCYTSEPTQRVRTNKVPKPITLAPATDKHPAQVQLHTEDVTVGTWTVTKFSGAMSAEELTDLKRRIAKLQDAVKVARERANQTKIEKREAGRALLDYLFQKN
jgi:hypothetical protein